MGKRGNREGYIYKAKNGSWIAKLQIGWLDNGNPKIKSFSAKTRADALNRMNEYKDLIEGGINIDSGSTKLYEGMITWLHSVKRVELKPSSYYRLEGTIESNIKPYIGMLEIKNVTANIVQINLINTLFEKGLSYSTIKKAFDALNAFFKYLLIRDVVIKNPMLGVVLPATNKFKDNTKKVKYLTSDEVERFKQQASRKTQTGTYFYRYGFAYIFMLYTGLRCGEMLGLQWKHIDLDNKVLYVRQSLITVKNDSNDGTKYITKLQDTTKTINGMREVPLCKTAIDAIQSHMNLFYNGDKNSFVVTSANGNLLRTRHFERSANYIFKRAGIQASGVHILRHTFASMLFDKKVDVKYISKLLGHSDVSTTYNIYIHLTSENISNEVNKLDL